MKDIRYFEDPHAWNDGEFYSYEELIASFEYEVLADETIGEYQGDSLTLFRDPISTVSGQERYGFLVFGWGSCSGCDALQACRTYEEIVQLRDQLHNDIHWGTRDAVIAHMKDKIASHQDFWTHEREAEEAVARLIALLEKQEVYHGV